MIPPLVSHIRKALSAGCTSRNFGRSEKDHAAQRGRDASGQRRASCASLSRRLSAFFGSTPDQGAKAAKYAVLPPGHAEFPKRVKCSEGSNSAPIQNAPVSACKPLCAILLAKASVCTRFHPRKQTWTVLQAIATRTFLPRGTH